MSMQLEPEAEKRTRTGKEEGTPVVRGNVFDFRFCFLSHYPSVKPKAVCAASRSPSAPSATGVLLQGCRPASPAGEVLSWDCEEEDEEWVLSLELLRVSVLVLVFFIFRLFASGALSTVCRRNPSRLHLLKA